MRGCDVSILICVRDRLELTRACLASLWASLPGGRAVEVLVFDDQSSDGTAAYLDTLGERVRVVRGAARGSFARNMNTLARQAAGRWLCLLNNDTVLHPGWLDALLDLASAQPRAAVIGNLHRFPHDNSIHHAGIVFDQDLAPRLLYQGLPDVAAAHATRPMQCVSGACWLVSAACFASLGGFDEQFQNGYEDMDFCLRAREAGGEIWYCGASRIDHHGQASAGRMHFEATNRRLFYERWQGKLVADLDEVTNRDGVAWPVRPRAFRLLHRLWRSPAAAPLRHLVLDSALGVRLRNRLLSVHHSPDGQV